MASYNAASSAAAAGHRTGGGSAGAQSESKDRPTSKFDGAHLDGASPTPGQRAFWATHDASVLNPLNWTVMVYMAAHELDVYYKGRFYKRYPAVFGRAGDPGTKLYEGDRRTPVGVYEIIQKYPSYRWGWFLRLNYPNIVDRERYDDLARERVLPVVAGRAVSEGGRIGIHGTDDPTLNRMDVNWTTGCISVEDGAIRELHRLLPVGTVVIIRP
jgi:L,D-transpeptidase catalytic domain